MEDHPHTVDGKNPAPVDMVNIPLFTGFHTCQVVQDFFHQQYGWRSKNTLPETNIFAPRNGWFPIGISKLPGVYFQGIC